VSTTRRRVELSCVAINTPLASKLQQTITGQNSAIANRSRVSCAHNTSRASIVILWP